MLRGGTRQGASRCSGTAAGGTEASRNERPKIYGRCRGVRCCKRAGLPKLLRQDAIPRCRAMARQQDRQEILDGQGRGHQGQHGARRQLSECRGLRRLIGEHAGSVLGTFPVNVVSRPCMGSRPPAALRECRRRPEPYPGPSPGASRAAVRPPPPPSGPPGRHSPRPGAPAPPPPPCAARPACARSPLSGRTRPSHRTRPPRVRRRW